MSSAAERKQARELAEARQSGAVPPAVDVKSGQIINPHNPEFITKKPWYLGGDSGEGPTLDHQADQRPDRDRVELSMSTADALVKEERRRLKELQKKQKFQVGMWVEALKGNKAPYRICQILKISKKGKEFDLKYEDGSIEKKVKFDKKKENKLFGKPRIRMTKVGARSIRSNPEVHGKETFDSKRDKYHGYDHEAHTKEVERIFNEREAIRKKLRSEEKNPDNEADGDQKEKHKSAVSDSDSDLDSDIGSDDSDDEFVQRDEDDRVHTTRLARQGGVGGAQMKVTARNLRIREDTAKYLRNLDIGSAYYDPKSRSMRDNPNPEVPAEEAQFAGDNFTRISGDAVNLAQTQMFAWDASSKGVGELHPQANPSQTEILNKKFKDKSATIRMQKKKAVLSKYGGAEYLDGSGGLADAVEEKGIGGKGDSGKDAAEERKIRFGVNTMAEQYTRDGRVLKGPQAAKSTNVSTKSKYQEDVFINGHSTVWGSYFHVGAFAWGYADDHSLIRNSYCTGENGRIANDEANEMRYGTGKAGSAALAQARGMLKALPGSKSASNASNAPPSIAMSSMYGEADPSHSDNIDKQKLQQALKDSEKIDSTDDRKRKYNSVSADIEVSVEEMEAYRMKKERSDDPMSKLDSEKLLDY